MTARCGSTLVGQMLSRVPEVRVISEPWVFMHIHGFYVQRLISLPQYQRLLKSALRLQCKRERHTCTHLFIKMSNFASPAFPILKQLFPDIQQANYHLLDLLFSIKNIVLLFDSLDVYHPAR